MAIQHYIPGYTIPIQEMSLDQLMDALMSLAVEFELGEDRSWDEIDRDVNRVKSRIRKLVK
jgi:hypothetical protein